MASSRAWMAPCTHSRSVRSLKEKFHVVGLLPKRARGEDVDSCFDECIDYPEGELED